MQQLGLKVCANVGEIITMESKHIIDDMVSQLRQRLEMTRTGANTASTEVKADEALAKAKADVAVARDELAEVSRQLARDTVAPEHAHQQVGEINVKRDIAKGSLAEADKKLVETREELAHAEKKLIRTNEQLTNNTKTLQKLDEHKKKCDILLVRANERIVHAKEQLAHAREQLAHAREQLAHAREQLAHAREEIKATEQLNKHSADEERLTKAREELGKIKEAFATIKIGSAVDNSSPIAPTVSTYVPPFESSMLPETKIRGALSSFDTPTFTPSYEGVDKEHPRPQKPDPEPPTPNPPGPRGPYPVPPDTPPGPAPAAILTTTWNFDAISAGTVTTSPARTALEVPTCAFEGRRVDTGKTAVKIESGSVHIGCMRGSSCKLFPGSACVATIPRLVYVPSKGPPYAFHGLTNSVKKGLPTQCEQKTSRVVALDDQDSNDKGSADSSTKDQDPKTEGTTRVDVVDRQHTMDEGSTDSSIKDSGPQSQGEDWTKVEATDGQSVKSKGPAVSEDQAQVDALDIEHDKGKHPAVSEHQAQGDAPGCQHRKDQIPAGLEDQRRVEVREDQPSKVNVISRESRYIGNWTNETSELGPERAWVDYSPGHAYLRRRGPAHDLRDSKQVTAFSEKCLDSMPDAHIWTDGQYGLHLKDTGSNGANGAEKVTICQLHRSLSVISQGSFPTAPSEPDSHAASIDGGLSVDELDLASSDVAKNTSGVTSPVPDPHTAIADEEMPVQQPHRAQPATDEDADIDNRSTQQHSIKASKETEASADGTSGVTAPGPDPHTSIADEGKSGHQTDGVQSSAHKDTGALAKSAQQNRLKRSEYLEPSTHRQSPASSVASQDGSAARNPDQDSDGAAEDQSCPAAIEQLLSGAAPLSAVHESDKNRGKPDIRSLVEQLAKMPRAQICEYVLRLVGYDGPLDSSPAF
ncbi:hypothetical protein GE09DRAFT_387405 [Coniochaeta sp. 2T2.1]|nr:hypothetical protein GE09DRAFT_387405 [Coniochaeta sp. 2T2.1]